MRSPRPAWEADARWERERVEIGDQRARRARDDGAALAAEREAQDAFDPAPRGHGVAELGERQLAFVAHHRVDRRHLVEHLAVREGREVAARRDVPVIAGRAHRRRERAELARAKLERHGQAHERRRTARDRVEHGLRLVRVVEGREVDRVPLGFDRGGEVTEREVLLDLGAHEQHVHGGLPCAASSPSRRICVIRPQRGRRIWCASVPAALPMPEATRTVHPKAPVDRACPKGRRASPERVSGALPLGAEATFSYPGGR